MSADDLTLERARERVEEWVRGTWWKRRAISAQLDVQRFEAQGAHHITFESFTEHRAIAPAHEPYAGGPVDGPENGSPPDAWEMPARAENPFVDEDVYYEVPHTAVVRTCGGCSGSGEVTCGSCGGGGQVTCGSCAGSGRQTATRTETKTDANGQTQTVTVTYTETCYSCGGSGRVTCSTCSGSGRVTCPTCGGARRLKHFQRLAVRWRNVVGERVLESSALPDEFVADAKGVEVLREEGDTIEPTSGTGGGEGARSAFRDAPFRVRGDVDKACNALLGAFSLAGRTRLLRQRLTVRRVPVYECRYRWGKDERSLWVYGLERRVFAPRYPLSWARISSVIAVCVALIVGVPWIALPRRAAPTPERVTHGGRPAVSLADDPAPRAPWEVPADLALRDVADTVMPDVGSAGREAADGGGIGRSDATAFVDVRSASDDRGARRRHSPRR